MLKVVTLETRTYDKYSEALKGAYQNLHPEEEIAVRQSKFIFAVLAGALGYASAQSEVARIIAGIALFGYFIYHMNNIANYRGVDE